MNFLKHNYILSNPIHPTEFDYTHVYGIKQFIKKCMEESSYFRWSRSMQDHKVPF